MAQGQFTKQEARATREALDEVMKGMTKKKAMEFIGHFNDIFLFINAAEKAAPTEEELAEIERKQTTG